VIIDCHGHYTTAPAAHTAWREQQVAAWEAGTTPPSYPSISDDEIRETIETSQLRLMDERGIDVTLFSPRASAMAPHVGDAAVSLEWSRRCNDLVHRVATLYPGRFVPVAQLPQSPGADLTASVAELRRCVEELGFVGCNLNPDPSGGFWTSPPLTDRSWYPLYEAAIELDVPAMVHVSGSATPVFHGTGAYYINADTTAFMQLVQGNLFGDLPELRLVIPHGGGAVPYHWGRYRGLADMLKQPPVESNVMGSNIRGGVFFDTCVYHQPGIDLLLDVIDTSKILFGSEMVGAVRGIDERTGHYYDDTRRYVEAAFDKGTLSDEARAAVFEGNVRRVYPRLAGALAR
jgi:4-oxalmesaconate hydratase